MFDNFELGCGFRSWSQGPVAIRAALRSSALLVVFLLPLGARAACSLATVSGNYAILLQGNEGSIGGVGDGVFRITGDGAGNLTGGVGAENISGTFYGNVAASGTYAVASNCWFTATITDSLTNVRNVAGVITASGGELHGLSTDFQTSMQLSAYRMRLSSCTQATAAGTYAGTTQVLASPSGTGIEVLQLNVGTAGRGSGFAVANFNDGTVVAGAIASVFSVNDDCTFTSTNKDSFGHVAHTFGVGGILENGVAGVSIGTDAGVVAVDTAIKVIE